MFVVVPVAQAQAESLSIPQVSSKPQRQGKLGEEETQRLFNESAATQLEGGQGQDYQQRVINDPRFTEYGRANAARAGTAANIGSGAQPPAAQKEQKMEGNVVIIRQEGAANKAEITQKGKNNKAIQLQAGEKNELNLTQEGEKNESFELQLGNENKKKKMVNGVLVEDVEE